MSTIIRELERELQDLHDERDELVLKASTRGLGPKQRCRLALLQQEILAVSDALGRARTPR